MKLLPILGCFIVSQAYAFNLELTNSTSYPLAYKVNSVCSSELGVLLPQTKKFISEAVIKKACGSYASCLIQAYVNHCDGTYVSGTAYNEQIGLISLDNGKVPQVYTYAGTYPHKLSILYLQI